MANFAGSYSYGSSSEESAYTLNSAATVLPTATPQADLATTTDLMMYIVVGVIAIIIAITIATILMLRKRP
jgi:hypothetical protein